MVSALLKYTWVACANLQKVPILERVCDATDQHMDFHYSLAVRPLCASRALGLKSYPPTLSGIYSTHLLLMPVFCCYYVSLT